jgi:hypothetical protein
MLRTLSPKNFARNGLALAAFAAAGMAFASSASAADCVNGLRTLESGAILQCDGGPTVYAPVESAYTTATPEFTGAIPAGGALMGSFNEPYVPSESRSLIVDRPGDCTPGSYWYMQHDTSYTVMAC